MYMINCPLPIYDGVATLGNPSLVGFSLNYTIVYGSGSSNATGTHFGCELDLTSNPHFQPNITYKNYGETLFGFIPYGWLGYIADFMTTLFQRIQSLFTLISFFIAPVNFNILGYTLDDLAGIPLMTVITVYSICYIFIGAWVYKVVSPFSGVS